MSISGLLDTARRALNVQTQAIRVVGDNIANVNTPGYSRRRGDIVTQPPGSNVGVEIGAGAQYDRTVRIVDKFLNDELGARMSDRAFAEIRSEILKRAEAPFALDSSGGRIGYQLNGFFGALEDLQTNPADLALRAQVLQMGQDLVSSIRQTYSQISSLQREADERTGILLEDVNRISQSIASLNIEISRADTAKQEALTLRDQREMLVRELNELVSVNTVENSDGSLLVYLGNGFSLVNGGQSRDLKFVNDPGKPLGLDGNPLRRIAYEFDAGPPPVYQDLTKVISRGSGEIGGLLSLRGVNSEAAGATAFDADGDLVRIAARIEYMTRDLLTRFNETYLNYVDADADPLTNDVPGSGTLDGKDPTTVGDIPSIFALFSIEGLTDLTPPIDDGDGLPRQEDLDTILSNNPQLSNFSSLLTFNLSNPRDLAAARDGNGLNPLEFATGDSANLDALLALRNEKQDYDYLGTNSGNPVVISNSTLDGVYTLSVSNVGALAAKAAGEVTVFGQREAQVRELQQSVSGVNLDEEFANLINFQRAFEAAARMIRVGDELFAQIIGLLG